MDLDNILTKALKEPVNEDEALYILYEVNDWEKLLKLFSIAGKIRDREIGRVYKLEAFIGPITKCTTDPPCRYCSRAIANTFQNTIDLRELKIAAKIVKEKGFRRIEIGGGTIWSGAGDLVVKAVETIKQVHPDAILRLNFGPSLSRSDLLKLKKLGVKEIGSNFETMNREVFYKMKPGDNLDRRIELAKEIDSLGIGLSTTILVGIGSSYEDYVKHLFWLKREIKNLSRISFPVLRPHPGGPLKDYPCGSLFDALKLGALSRIIFRNIDIGFGGIANDPRLLYLRIMAGGNREVHISFMVTKKPWPRTRFSPSEIRVEQIGNLYVYDAVKYVTRVVRELGFEISM